MPQRMHKAWAGRMAEPTNRLVESFTTSYPFDRRLYAHDIAGSITHCEMLARQRIIPRTHSQRIITALRQIKAEFDSGRFRPSPADEDIHMAVERRLIEKVGSVGGELHTARSRNDQVALDLRLFLREEIAGIRQRLGDLRHALATLAARHPDVILPGYTHLQPAQPVLFGHHCLAYAEMLARDAERFADCSARLDVLPLGSGALAGTTFPIDRMYVARRLGFRAVSTNSMDAVSDRDFAAEFLAACAILGMHLSRLAEDLILWSSQEFGFVELPDAFATGSSIMPQKKNPDVAELIRGKTGRLYGNLLSLLTTLKGLPMTYNRDLQEDKEPVFDSVDTVKSSLEVLSALLPQLHVRPDRMRAAATAGFTLATELADYLATKGVPFRAAHGVVGAIVRQCLATGRALQDLSLAELRRFSPRFGADVQKWLSAAAAVRRRRAIGGTSPDNVRRQLRRHRS
ncbi:MAG TPA: argininosuccinate lyase [Candidatus Margulisiibacteriota bacterium]|nr:argininosuccinate lyase [Candidatus Margulisiibacteriota bacterium]